MGSSPQDRFSVLAAGAAALAFGTAGALLFTRQNGFAAAHEVALLAHLAISAAIVGPLALYIATHLRARHGARIGTRSGWALLAMLLGLLASGVLAALPGRSSLSFYFHWVCALSVPLLFILHRSSQRRALSLLALHWRPLAVLAITVPTFILGTAWLVSLSREPATAAIDPFISFIPRGAPDPGSPFYPSSVTTASGGYVDEAELSSDSCAGCHPDIFAQWSASAHRFSSFDNPFYAAAVDLTREDRGDQASQWCGGCHDPVLLLSRGMIGPIDRAARDARSGITCLVCHGARPPRETVGNGNYQFCDDTRRSVFAEDSALHQLLLRVAPGAHAAQMKTSAMTRSEFCAPCHKVSLDRPVNAYRWLRGQNEYDAWHDSGFAGNNPWTFYEPPERLTCQDCHMPLEAAVRGDLAATDGLVRSHRFVAANTALPHVLEDRGWLERTEQFLRGALRVDVFALRRGNGELILDAEHARPVVLPGEVIEIHVVVRNLRVGHTFPGGTNDSNEAWLSFVARSGGQIVAESGSVGDDGFVDPSSHFFQAVFVDERSRRIDRRNVHDFRATVYHNRIPPGASDIARYRFRVPPTVDGGVLEVEAALLWRKFNRTFTNFAFSGQTVPALPITRIAGHRLLLDVRAPAQRTPPAEADWTRWNDYGIGLLLDGETKAAVGVFDHVVERAPAVVDGWLNQARAHLSGGSLEAAARALERAAQTAPEDRRVRLFEGRLREEEGRLAEAAARYRSLAVHYPSSRGLWLRIGRSASLAGEAEGALSAYLNVLAIDPEHAEAHYHRSGAYRALAARTESQAERARLDRAAGEAMKAFEKYKIDEDAERLTQLYRGTHPDENRMSQLVVIHDVGK